MIENKSHIAVKNGTERNFGLVIGGVFIIIALFPLIGSGPIRAWALVPGIVLIVLAILKPSILRLPNLLWFKFGLFLGAIVAPIVMALVFFLVVTPTGIIMRLLGKDLLRKKIDPDTSSYWISRETPPGTMKNQF